MRYRLTEELRGGQSFSFVLSQILYIITVGLHYLGHIDTDFSVEFCVSPVPDYKIYFEVIPMRFRFPAVHLSAVL